MATSEGHQTAPSVNDDAGATKPRVIPTNQLVILRESELDCDLTTAIQRIREDQATTASRILIVGPGEDARSDAPDAQVLPLPQMPMSIGQVARSGGQKSLAAAAERLTPKVESLDCLMAEAHVAVSDLEDVARDGTMARIHSRVRVVKEVVEWLRATTDDLQQDVSGMRQGFQRIDVVELLLEIHGQVESFFPRLRVNVAPVGADADVWGQASTLSEGLFLAIVLTAHRIGGCGSVNIEVEPKPDNTVIRIIGLGEPVEVHAPEQMDRFREIIAAQHRGRIVPDSLGPFGTGLVLELPSQP